MNLRQAEGDAAHSNIVIMDAAEAAVIRFTVPSISGLPTPRSLRTVTNFKVKAPGSWAAFSRSRICGFRQVLRSWLREEGGFYSCLAGWPEYTDATCGAHESVAPVLLAKLIARRG